MLAAALAGFAASASLILAIGAQNAFVLRQGLARAHVFAVCLICSLSDMALIAVGVAGFGWASDAAPWFEPALRYGGAAFLFAYGARSLWAARAPGALKAEGPALGTVRDAVLTCLALTWLNPHVYLDTLALLGALAAPYPLHERWAFGGGAMAASVIFFFALGYGARALAPIFARPAAWRVLDLLVGALMIVLAVSLALS